MNSTDTSQTPSSKIGLKKIPITTRIMRLWRAEQRGMKRWRVDVRRSGRRSNLVDADFAPGEGRRRRNGGASSAAHVLVRTPSVTLSSLCSNSSPQSKRCNQENGGRNSIDYLLTTKAAPFFGCFNWEDNSIDY